MWKRCCIAIIQLYQLSRVFLLYTLPSGRVCKLRVVAFLLAGDLNHTVSIVCEIQIHMGKIQNFTVSPVINVDL